MAKKIFAEHVGQLQEQITCALGELSPQVKVVREHWKRPDSKGDDGGGGLTHAVGGGPIESGGVNTSLIYGQMERDFARQIGADGRDIWAAGISIILHPYSPRIPTIHGNFRLIQAGKRHWFGGGADLTPFYPSEEDFHHFHRVWRQACRPYGSYAQWSRQCNEYFANHHRGGEKRGIGGIFFDHHNSGNLERDLAMVTDLSNCFMESWFPIAKRHLHTPWTQADRDFQLHRRGRYVEFNLLHDRGTTFGLQSGGRTESILISLPRTCKFSYNYQPAPNSPHQKMMGYYQNSWEWGEEAFESERNFSICSPA